jgi:hypothetical protein
MNELLDARIWTGVERRLADVEALIPEAPGWLPATVVEPENGVEFRLGRTLAPGVRPARRTRPRLVLALAVVGLLVALLAAAILAGAGRTTPIDLSAGPFGPYGLYRGSNSGSNSAALPDGRVLIVSGAWQGAGTAVARADLWDPALGSVPASPTITARVNPTATLLLDGRVLIVGGYGGPFQYASSALASLELWDPASGEFRPAGSMADARVRHTATLLPDGRVLVIGGTGPDGTYASAELWDPDTTTTSHAGTLRTGRAGHASVLLPDGQVLVVGGRDVTGDGVGITELWNPSTRGFREAATFLDKPPNVTATRLLDGRVLMAGAWIFPGGFRGVSVRPYPSGPAEDTTMSQPREGHAATLLPDGNVLITGGGPTGTGEATASAELWELGTGAFRAVRSMPQAAAGHSAFLLPDGRVLIVLDGSGPERFVAPFIYAPTVEP